MRQSYRSSTNVGVWVLLIWLGIVAVGLFGWVHNIVVLWHMDNILSTGMGVIRVVGIPLAPLGAFLGLFIW